MKNYNISVNQVIFFALFLASCIFIGYKSLKDEPTATPPINQEIDKKISVALMSFLKKEVANGIASKEEAKKAQAVIEKSTTEIPIKDESKQEYAELLIKRINKLKGSLSDLEKDFDKRCNEKIVCSFCKTYKSAISDNKETLDQLIKKINLPADKDQQENLQKATESLEATIQSLQSNLDLCEQEIEKTMNDLKCGDKNLPESRQRDCDNLQKTKDAIEKHRKEIIQSAFGCAVGIMLTMATLGGTEAAAEGGKEAAKQVAKHTMSEVAKQSAFNKALGAISKVGLSQCFKLAMMLIGGDGGDGSSDKSKSDGSSDDKSVSGSENDKNSNDSSNGKGDIPGNPKITKSNTLKASGCDIENSKECYEITHSETEFTKNGSTKYTKLLIFKTKKDSNKQKCGGVLIEKDKITDLDRILKDYTLITIDSADNFLGIGLENPKDTPPSYIYLKFSLKDKVEGYALFKEKRDDEKKVSQSKPLDCTSIEINNPT